MERAPSPRKRTVREVTRREKVAGVVILTLLVVIAGFVFWKGRNYDPGLFALDASLLEGTGTGAAQANARARFLPMEVEGADWPPAGDVETFTADNLYIKIDGRAEQYIQYGVKGLECQTYAPPDNPDLFLDLFVYDMGTPLQAFGIFSAERTPGQEAIQAGEQGYRSGASLFFWQGPFYVQILTAADTPTVRAAADAFAASAGDRLPQEGATLWPLQIWSGPPWEKDTLQYQRSQALSLDFLNHAFTIHREGDSDFARAFLSLRADEEQAQQIWNRFLEYYQGYGTIHRQERDEQGEWLVADVAGFYDGVCRQGSLLAGVTGFEEEGPAAERLAELREHLKTVPATLWEEVLPEWRQVLAATPETPADADAGYQEEYP